VAQDDRLAAVVFGEQARVAVAPVAPDAVPDLVPDVRSSPHGTALAAALRLAAGLEPAGGGRAERREIVLVTDGRATDAAESLQDAALALRRAGCVAFEIRRVETVGLPSRATEVRGPGRVVAGAPFSLEVRGIAHEAGATVRLLREARPVEERRIPAPGPFRVTFARIEDSPGTVRYRAVATASPALPAPATRVVVGEPGTALVLGAGPARPQLVATLAGRARWLDVVADPGTLDDRLLGHGAVVVDGVPDATLGVAAVQRLERWVAGGGGLLLLGGPGGFGAGGWAGRPIDTLAPLRSRPPEDEALLLYLAIDGSGSMAHAWPGAEGAPGSLPRDAVVRSAAEALVRGAASDTVLTLRRFAGTLLPPGSPAIPVRMDADGRESAIRALRAFEPPAGATALLPPLEEARALFAARPGGRRRVVLLSDARTEEPLDALTEAVGRLPPGGLTLVLPGPDDPESPGARVRAALRAAGVAVLDAAREDDLVGVLRGVEERARVDHPIAGAARLRRAAGASGWLGATRLPPGVARRNRAWAAPDAVRLVETEEGDAVAALRRHGLGRVAALATRPGDAAWLTGDPAEDLVKALVAAVERPWRSAVRVEFAQGELHVTASGGGSQARPAAVEIVRPDGAALRAPLRPGVHGVLTADVSRALPERDAVVRVLDAAGAAVATLGLDAPAPAEYRRPRAADLDELAALARSPDAAASVSLRPWLAALAVLCVLAGSAASLRARGERRAGRPSVQRPTQEEEPG
jgi:hypothetical protein